MMQRTWLVFGLTLFTPESPLMPANCSPSFAKTIIRRPLEGVLDRHPTKSQLRELVEHFGSCCAYCGKRIHLNPKDAQLDHIDPSGANNISNRLYACEDCNEKKELDRPWRDFLRSIAKSDGESNLRAAKIESWMARFDGLNVQASHQVERQRDLEIDAAIRAFDGALANIRDLREKRS